MEVLHKSERLAALLHGRSRLSITRLRLVPALSVIVALLAAGLLIRAAVSGNALATYTTLWAWTPLLWKGFEMNLLMSVLAMLIGTVFGVMLGALRLSLLLPSRGSSFVVVQFLRNAPWLVTMFYVMYLLPFEFTVFGVSIPVPDWLKATVGLSLPAMANVAEIVRGGIQSIPGVQWEAAAALGFSRRRTLWRVIAPQCIKRVLPPWMNLYAIVTMGTSLANIVGVAELLTITRQILQSQMDSSMLLPMYGFDLALFFIYLYPISLFTRFIERRWLVNE